MVSQLFALIFGLQGFPSLFFKLIFAQYFIQYTVQVVAVFGGQGKNILQYVLKYASIPVNHGQFRAFL